ncbi:hypothetical protein GFC01_02060 [Desulfofundulus thermobenzoicus]|uniref:Vitamin K epoxide reductase domain-containing protein n=1 Tax=Desulfofundulus thermobenzoicus TaxID=29376 RepID=A0A6N7IN52_9FIRM|nr:vitamin K epoxide reductase family protein [Desulfofundulus thermobenzoicus]MQL51073.1 hypothetical protein [Desulfofundulus thermobenzoicus]
MGAAFYLAVGVFLSVSGWNRFAMPLLLAGIAVHAVLLSYGYLVTGGLCPVCMGFAAVTCLLLAGSLWLERRRRLSVSAAAIAMTILVLAGMTALNPAVLNEPRQPVSADPPAYAAVQETVPASELVHFNEKPVQVAAKTYVDRNEERTMRAKDLKPGNNEHAHAQISGTSNGQTRSVGKSAEAKPITLTVQDVHGNPVVLDITQRPALLFAPRCPECHKVLAWLSRRKELPYLVGTWYLPGKQDEIATVLAQEGLPGAEYFVMPDPPVNAVPALIFNDGGQVKTVSGDVKVENLLRELMQP